MDYQLLALDLDGTLTNSKKEVSEPTIKAVSYTHLLRSLLL